MIKNKLIIILLIFILVITNLTTVFAYDIVSESGTTYTFPDNIVDYIKETPYYNENYYCIGIKYIANSNYYVIFAKKTDTLIFYINSPSDFKCSEDVERYQYIFDSRGVLISSGSINTGFLDSYNNFGNKCGSGDLFLGFGTYYKTDGSVFFHLPPQIVEGPEKEPIPEVGMKETFLEMGEIAKEKIIQMILIVIAMAVFLVISLIGVKKGWQILVCGLKT